MPITSTQTTLELTPVSLTLNRPDVQKLDDLALKRQTNRSALVRTALQEFLGRQEQGEVQTQGRKTRK
jgi:predicted transcriptional regulator